jgi:hypothetical protein
MKAYGWIFGFLAMHPAAALHGQYPQHPKHVMAASA